MKTIVTVQGSTFLPEGVVISKKKSNPGSNFNLGNIYWGVLISPKISTGEYLFRGVHFYGDTGIDTNIYEAHSCRAASSSKAKQIRISVPEIFKRGCWSTNSIF